MAKPDRQGVNPSAKAPRTGQAASAPAPVGGAPPRWWARTGVVAGAIFVLLLAVYNFNGLFLYGNDAKPNVYLPAALLAGRGITFTPSEYPFMFCWALPSDRGWDVIQFINSWDERVPGQPYTYRQLFDARVLKLYQPKYYLVPSIRKTAQGEPICVNTFGPGAGLTALPVFAVLHLAVGGDLRSHPAALWYGAKVAGSLLVAGSAAFVFLTARAFTKTAPAALIALAYGLGTGVWSTSSQTLWQHGPNEFFLAMGAYFLMRARDSWKHAAACGGALSAAVACRPTSVVVAVAVGVYLLVDLARTRRKALLPYVLAALPVAVGLGAYNTYYLGRPWEFGQAKVGREVAMGKTGSADLWQTPLLVGAAGLMISPSRGLLVFSPFMAFALVGGVRVWTRRRYAPLWPLAVAMLVLLGIAFKWFDWWGGWCYGPRPIVDTMPFFVLMLIPVIGWVCRRKAALAVFLVLLLWSAAVQALGVLTYEMFGWNKRTEAVQPLGEFPYDRFRAKKWTLAEVTVEGHSSAIFVTTLQQFDSLARTYTIRRVSIPMDIDEPAYRHRLWSLRDNQILYYVRNFHQALEKKAEYVEIWLKEPGR